MTHKVDVSTKKLLQDIPHQNHQINMLLTVLNAGLELQKESVVYMNWFKLIHHKKQLYMKAGRQHFKTEAGCDFNIHTEGL